MQKLEKELYIKHAKRLQAILDSQSSFIPFLNRSDLQQTIKNELNVLFACEKKFTKVNVNSKLTAKVLAKQFNKLTKNNFEINENYKYEDDADLIDAINYLVTFCNNMFKVNLDDLVSGKKITATDPKIDLRAKASMDNEGPKMNRNFAFAGSGMSFASTPYENPYLIGKAYAKLADDMKQGKFYQYKTQPRIILVMKTICLIGLILLSLATLSAAILIFMCSSLTITDGTDTGTLSQVYGTIASGVMYAILAAFIIYPTYILAKGIHGANLNTKYFFHWGIFAATILLVFIVVMPDMRVTWLRQYAFSEGQENTIAMAAYNGWKIMYIVILSSLSLILFPMVIGAIFNPKPDTEAIDRKIREYIDLFSSEMGTNPVPPKADVQKPTDVKPSKGKKKK